MLGYPSWVALSGIRPAAERTAVREQDHGGDGQKPGVTKAASAVCTITRTP